MHPHDFHYYHTIAAIPFAFNFLVPFYSLYKAAYSGYHRSSDYEEDDYYDGGYDRSGLM